MTVMYNKDFNDTELERAVNQLVKHYHRALENPTIHNPIAWSLYHVWRIEDSRKNKDKKGKKDAD